ncbi:MAG: ABC transporter ATP-binding protein/permease [Pseudomonadota bacterium]
MSPHHGTPPPGKTDWKAIKSLLPYLWEYRARVLLAFSFLIIAKLASVATPLMLKDIVDSLDGTLHTALILPVGLLLGYGALRVINAVFGELRDMIFAKVTQRAIRRIALQVFSHLHRLSLRFHLDRKTGGVSRDIERGTRGIQFLLNFMIFNILPTLFEIVLVAVILFAKYEAIFAIITFGSVAFYVAFTMIVTEWRMKFRRTMNEMDSQANTRAIDSLLNYETVKYFGNEAYEARRYDENLSHWETAAVKNQSSLSLLNAGQGSIIAVALAALVYLAAERVVAGTMTLGDLVLINMYLIQLFMPLNFLGFVYREIKNSLADIERMFGLLGEHREIEDKPDAPALALHAGSIRFEEVSFHYQPERPILHQLSFEVPAGKKVAVVGHSGAGKSTLSRLMFRFYDVSGGAIYIDDQDIREVTQQSLRAAIGIVPQDTVLFNDTIHYNISYAKPGARDEEIHAAARLANIHDFIVSLPKGYESVVGERGLKLSGGEKQRIAIARAVLKKPAIMVFDEATSSLDSHSEQEILKALRELAADHTTLVIAHRLSTIVDADEILVMNQGRIIERGAHRELLAHDGHYARMWRLQLAEHREQITTEEIPAEAQDVYAR